MGKRYEPVDSGGSLAAGDNLAASWVASARLLLTFLSMLVVLLARTVPTPEQEGAFVWALAASGGFFAVALISRLALARGWVAAQSMLVAGPMVDLALSGFLVLATNGYLSPFTLWIVFAVVETAFVGRARLTMLVAALGAIVHLLVALVPQDRPLDTAVLLVRVSYLAGFAVLVGSVGGILARRNRELAGIEELGRRLQEAPDIRRACVTAARIVAEALGAKGIEVAAGDASERFGPSTEGEAQFVWEVKPDARVSMWRKRPLDQDELAVGRVMTDRLALAIRRLRLTQTLVEGAAREERLRLADEVHDGYLQTLAAATMRLEVARKLTESKPEAAEEIAIVKQLLRDGTNRARAFLSGQLVEPPNGPDRLRSILHERWLGEWQMNLSPDIELSDAQWEVCAMLLREGLNNAVVHGRATRATFSITRTKGRVQIALECDGRSPPSAGTIWLRVAAPLRGAWQPRCGFHA